MIIRYATAGGETKTIVFDATLREVHTAAGTVTEHAVEKGGKVSDHFRPSQKRVSIEAVISNTPIKPVGGKTGEVRAVNLDVKDSHVVAPGVRLPNRRSQGAQVLQFSQQFDRVKDVLAELNAIAEAGTLIEIVNGIVDYQDMVIVSLSAPREAASGSTITVTIDAVHIRFVETSTVDAPAPRKQNKRTKRGNKGTKEIKPEEKKKRESAFHAGKDWALGQIGLR
jgi:hypothetical protein